MVEPPALAVAVRERVAEQLPRLRRRRGSAPGRAPSRRRRPARSSSGRPSSSSLRKSRTSRTVFGVSVVKKVVFVVTRKPRRLASWIASTALSNTPSRSTNSSCRSRSPSMCTTHAKYGDGLKWSSFLLQQDRVRAQVDELLALDQLPRHHVDLGMHQRLAAGDRHHRRAGLLDRRRPPARPASASCSMCSGCWIFPQNEHARLHGNSGSSSTSSGNLSLRRIRCRSRYAPDRRGSGGAGRSSRSPARDVESARGCACVADRAGPLGERRARAAEADERAEPARIVRGSASRRPAVSTTTRTTASGRPAARLGEPARTPCRARSRRSLRGAPLAGHVIRSVERAARCARGARGARSASASSALRRHTIGSAPSRRNSVAHTTSPGASPGETAGAEARDRDRRAPRSRARAPPRSAPAPAPCRCASRASRARRAAPPPRRAAAPARAALRHRAPPEDAAQRHHREHLPVQVVIDVEVAGEAGAR